MESKKIRLTVLTGVFAAMIFVATAYLHVNTNAGYTHFGDSILFIASSLLPSPYAAAAGAIGAGLADLVSMPIWTPATIIIKAVTAFFFSSKKETIINKRNILSLLPSLLLCIIGYSLYEAVIMTGGLNTASIVKAFASTPAYCVQIGGSSAIYLIAGKALDKISIKKHLMQTADITSAK